MYNISICLSDIPQDKINVANNGKMYVNLTVGDKRETDQYGYDAYVSVSQTKEEREAQQPRQYVGRGKKIQLSQQSNPPATHPFAAQQPTDTPTQQPQQQSSFDPAIGDDLPF